MLETIIILVFVFWLLGFVAHVGGDFIHLLLILMAVLVIVRVAHDDRIV